MKILSTLIGFFRLIRSLNLFFIVLTQVFFYYLIILPQYSLLSFSKPRMDGSNFIMILVASILIAAGGYIINDYFDIDIDRVNKPQRLIVGTIISRRWAMFFHFLLSLLGLLFTGFVSASLNNNLLFILNFFSVVLLWLYSTLFKRKILIGNIIISLLSAWVVLVLYVCEMKFDLNGVSLQSSKPMLKIYQLAVIYAGFAFIISLVREIVKDMQDIEGDRKYSCQTMPIVWGITASKLFISVWIVVLFAVLFFMMGYAVLKSFFLLAAYVLFFLIVPLIDMLVLLYNSSKQEDFKKISLRIKIFMLFGILSMIIYYYHL